MSIEALKDFVHFSDVDKQLVNEYKDKLPKQLINLWEKNGLGSFMSGYLKVIDPNEYLDILNKSYFRASVSIPIMVTAFGDIITWEKNRYVGIVRYKYGTSEIMMSSYDLFITLLNDNYFVKKFFQFELYINAVEKYGALNYDECFGYIPILALGGKETIEQMKKVKTREHIALITSLTGEIFRIIPHSK